MKRYFLRLLILSVIAAIPACDRPASSGKNPGPDSGQSLDTNNGAGTSSPAAAREDATSVAPVPMPTPTREDGIVLPPLSPDQKPSHAGAVDMLSLAMDPITERFSAPGSDKPYSGFAYTTMAGGKLASEGLIANGFVEGEWVEYHENGKIAAKGSYKNGMEEGAWIFYLENGEVEYEASFKEGTPDGFWKLFDEQGRLDSQGNFKDGLMDGVWEYFDVETGVATPITYSKGVKVSK